MATIDKAPGFLVLVFAFSFNWLDLCRPLTRVTHLELLKMFGVPSLWLRQLVF